jgi:hypothetical protein
MRLVIQVASIVLRLSAALALILGLLFWSGSALNLVPIHMLLGILVVCSLWTIGVGQAFTGGGSWLFAAGALALGLIVVAVGRAQSGLLVGSFHWVIQVTHLLLGALAVGVGQIGAKRYRNSITTGDQVSQQAV